MILDFVKYLSEQEIAYKFTNGYNEIFEKKQSDSDFDILFKKSDFSRIDIIIKDFCFQYNFKQVQVYDQDLWAKNFFVYDEIQNEFLNLDLYGEISRRQIKILNETDVFHEDVTFRDVSILSPQLEFIQYFIKKLDKNQLSKDTYNYLLKLYSKEVDGCNIQIRKFFRSTSDKVIHAFESNDFEFLSEKTNSIISEFKLMPKNASSSRYKTLNRLIKRIIKPTGITIAFLGPDGSGKSTVIDKLKQQHLPYRKNTYFHLKPIYKDSTAKNIVISNPHELPLYSFLKSYVKIIYFLIQYNFYWIKNVLPLKIRSSLVIFDRYYEDLLVDNKRYRFGGNIKIATYLRSLLFKPEIYFVLIADAQIIHNRKKEVSLDELETQLLKYRKLSELRQFHLINVNRPPDDIVKEITTIMMKYMNKRYK
ncbi:hypothetical protein [Zobellia uliginosa]|uniref:hypothetical protein n=1 Tax=Zobellia uliginosa TaxID=143224 RepID=UPI001C068507|nr:hypothetical protein [Zobellia uliginosa]MBU2947836.1 hypothetical protein [Zobellia uliginosa]